MTCTQSGIPWAHAGASARAGALLRARARPPHTRLSQAPVILLRHCHRRASAVERHARGHFILSRRRVVAAAGFIWVTHAVNLTSPPGGSLVHVSWPTAARCAVGSPTTSAVDGWFAAGRGWTAPRSRRVSVRWSAARTRAHARRHSRRA